MQQQGRSMSQPSIHWFTDSAATTSEKRNIHISTGASIEQASWNQRSCKPVNRTLTSGQVDICWGRFQSYQQPQVQFVFAPGNTIQQNMNRFIRFSGLRLATLISWHIKNGGCHKGSVQLIQKAMLCICCSGSKYWIDHTTRPATWIIFSIEPSMLRGTRILTHINVEPEVCDLCGQTALCSHISDFCLTNI